MEMPRQSVEVVTAPTNPPVALADVKLYLRRDDTTEDALITDLIWHATEWLQSETGQQICTSVNRLWMDSFPSFGYPRDYYGFPGGSTFVVDPSMQLAARVPTFPYITIPTPPLQSVASVQYLSGGSWQTLSTSAYNVDAKGMPGRIVVLAGTTWPVSDEVPNAVQIEYTAGYGDPTASPTPIPYRFQQAIKWLVGHCYEHREAASDLKLEETPLALRSVVEQLMFREAYSA